MFHFMSANGWYHIVCPWCLGIGKTSCFFFTSCGQLRVCMDLWKLTLVRLSWRPYTRKNEPKRKDAILSWEYFSYFSSKVSISELLSVCSVCAAGPVSFTLYLIYIFFFPHRKLNRQCEQTRFHVKSQSSPFLPNPFQALSWVASCPLAAFSSSSSSFSTVSGTPIIYSCVLFKTNTRNPISVKFKPGYILTFCTCRSHQMYYMFGFLFLVFIILLITCSEATVLLCYFHLCAEVRLWTKMS